MDVYVSPALEAMGMSPEERLRRTREAAARVREAMGKGGVGGGGTASNPGGAAAGPSDTGELPGGRPAGDVPPSR